ncbi:RHO1 GDP-GTP exchange protein 2 [Irineochytrium annulatum]|nr:RHO1 GDP-GTP exchange protein 2 [Irineochytrium annulatum]
MSTWAETVPAEIRDSLPADELRRQEHIFELVKNQKNYVEELTIINEKYLTPLSTSDILEPSRRNAFLSTVFTSMADLLLVNTELLTNLEEVQKKGHVIQNIATILSDSVGHWDAMYPAYFEKLEMAKLEVDQEIRRNPRLAEFLENTRKAGGRFSLNELLGIPFRRVTSYNLLISDIIKRSAPENSDKVELVKVKDMITEVIKRGETLQQRSANARKFLNYYEKIQPRVLVETLNLLGPERDIIFEGDLLVEKIGGNPATNLRVLLFDHVLIMAAETSIESPDGGPADKTYKIFKRPIPLDLLRVSKSENAVPAMAQSSLFFSQTINPDAPQQQQAPAPRPGVELNKTFYVEHVAREHVGGAYTLTTTTEASRDAWVRKIQEQQAKRAQAFPIVETVLTEEFPAVGQHTLIGSIAYGNRLFVANSSCVYLGAEGGAFHRLGGFKPKVELEGIRAMDAIPAADMLFVLTEKVLWAFSIREIVSTEGMVNASRARKVADDVSFFKIGVCDGNTYVCAIKTGSIRSYIKLLDPTQEKRRFLSKSSEMKVEKEFYIPTVATSIDFLKTKLVVGCTRGFEIVDLKRVGAESNAPLMDPRDENLNFMTSRGDRQELSPIAVFRIVEGDFLLCFKDIGLYVNKSGQLTRPEWKVTWQSEPISFAYQAPYILAFSPTHVEIYHTLTGELRQAMIGVDVVATHIAVEHTGAIDSRGIESGGTGHVHYARSGINGMQVLSRLHLRS